MNGAYIKMKQFTWNAPFVNVLANLNTLLVKDEDEFNIAKKLFANVGLELKTKWYDYKRMPGFKGVICLEVQNWKGFSVYFDPEESKNWYEADPVELKDIIEV
jgi:hypothetical protein